MTGGISEKLGVLALAVSMLSLGSSKYPFVLILCYIIHELGHLFFSKLMGARAKSFKIGGMHLSIFYDSSNLSYKREIVVQLGGIIFNLLSALFVYILPIFRGDVSVFFVVASISLALMNLYPVSILDGGGVFKNILLLCTSEENAQRVSRGVWFASAILMWLISVYLQIFFVSNLSLFLISVLLLVQLCLGEGK